MDTFITFLQNQYHFLPPTVTTESLEERRKVKRLAFMHKILNDQMAVPAGSVDLILSSRPSRSTGANQHN